MSALDINDGSVQELDLNIRAASTLLSVLHPQVEQCSPGQQSGKLARLDRIALLFVRSEEDNAAVSITIDENQIQLLVAETGERELVTTENSQVEKG